MSKNKAELEVVARKLFAVAVGMVKCEKSPAEIQTFLAQYVAVSKKLSSHNAAELVNEVMKVFTEHIEETGVLAAPSNALVDVSDKTHILPPGAKVLTDEEYRTELSKLEKEKEQTETPQ